MKKKSWIALLSLIATICLSFALAGCGKETGDNPSGHTHKWSTTYTEDEERGEHYQTCSGCDEKKYSNHEYKNGKCVCGKSEPKPSEGLEYTLSEDEASYVVSGIGTCTDTEIYIPAEHDGKPVKSIGENAFEENASIKYFTISNGVTDIGNNAFSRCSSLIHIIIPESVTSIGDCAFYACGALKSINIPNGVTCIPYLSFTYCISLESITISDNLTTIETSAFGLCSSIKNIIVGENNQNYKLIDGNLYSKDGKTFVLYAKGNTAETFVIPNGVTRISDSAFGGSN